MRLSVSWLFRPFYNRKELNTTLESPCPPPPPRPLLGHAIRHAPLVPCVMCHVSCDALLLSHRPTLTFCRRLVWRCCRFCLRYYLRCVAFAYYLPAYVFMLFSIDYLLAQVQTHKTSECTRTTHSGANSSGVSQRQQTVALNRVGHRSFDRSIQSGTRRAPCAFCTTCLIGVDRIGYFVQGLMDIVCVVRVDFLVPTGYRHPSRPPPHTPGRSCCRCFPFSKQFIYALGPIAHMQENSKYFSSKPCPRPAVMPRVTIQMPVSKAKSKTSGREANRSPRRSPSHCLMSRVKHAAPQVNNERGNRSWDAAIARHMPASARGVHAPLCAKSVVMLLFGKCSCFPSFHAGVRISAQLEFRAMEVKFRHVTRVISLHCVTPGVQGEPCGDHLAVHPVRHDGCAALQEDGGGGEPLHQ